MSPSAIPRKIQIVRVGNVTYRHADIDRARAFLEDFGFIEVQRSGTKTYYRGYGLEPWVVCAESATETAFGGAGLIVESIEDLELATEVIPEASKIYDLDSPGGGKCVTIKDPVDGWPMHLIYGQATRDAEDDFKELQYNFPNSKHRPVNKTQRFQKRPAPIHKMGHFGVCVTNFQQTYDFYTKHFNFKASELLHDETGRYTTSFMHLDRGKELVDHHVFFIFEGPKWHVHHSSFEVHDFDIQVLGHDWLREKGWKNCWGVGRHVMGSQIFDYWYDSSGFILEHYADGDLVNETTETSISQTGLDGLYVWGPDLPSEFMQ